MTHRVTFNATSRRGNMLSVFESDSKTYNIVARILQVARLKIVSWNIPLPTVAATNQKLSGVTD